MSSSIKQEIHQLVDQCDNEILLEEAREILQTENDWWDELSPTDQTLVMESEAQYERGDFIDHKELLRRFEEWKKK
jgi:hypothetical protein